ncbi:MAG: YicC family protein [Gammaproteobacteria bacterium]|nr:MAG: YicC family protein [Gammaproteobacteria bacterium]
MIYSMTAFARVNENNNIGHVQWEIRSVNQRFLDLNFRFPEVLRHLEMPIREKVRKKLNRGKLDINLRYTPLDATASGLSINENLINSLQLTHSKIAELSNNTDKLSTIQLMQWPGVLQEPETDEKNRDKVILALFDQVIEQLLTARSREGEAMKSLLLDRINLIKGQVLQVRDEFPAILQWQKDRIITRFQEAKIEPDNERLEHELVYLAQKADIAEEVDRLETHVEEITRILNKGGNVGRRLDFLLQELNREANTLGSKSINKMTTAAAVELKVIIEQMREQVQNIE